MTRPLLHQRWPELAESLPHLPLGDVPTPVRPLAGLGCQSPLWLKDESGYGHGGWGGNKVRKLEWLLPEAHRRGARTLLTVGGLGTNWGLAAALYAPEQGLTVALALIDHPVDGHTRAQLRRLRASGATLHFLHTKTRLILAAPWLFARHSSMRGPTLPYFLPAGGSSPLGTLGYVETALELAAQVSNGLLPEPGWVVTAVGSGGTAAGLALGLRLAGLRTRVLGIVVNDTLRLDSTVLNALARKSEALLRNRGAALPHSASARTTSASTAAGSVPAMPTQLPKPPQHSTAPPPTRGWHSNTPTPPRPSRRSSTSTPPGASAPSRCSSSTPSAPDRRHQTDQRPRVRGAGRSGKHR